MSSFERLVLRGSPYERGRQHGREFADAIDTNVEVYEKRFAHDGLDLQNVREAASTYVDVIESHNADYAAEMRGVADGSGRPLAEIAMLNVRWEIFYTAQSPADSHAGSDAPASAADACTSFGVRSAATEDGGVYMGQNWDWLVPIEDTVFLMEHRNDDAPDSLALTEAGIVGGKIGFNEHGIGIAVNGLVSDADGDNAFAKPYHVRFREVLETDRFDTAVEAILQPERACSANVLLGHADGEFVDLEAAPGDVHRVYPDEDVLTHSNHFTTDAIDSPAEERPASTFYRARRLRRHLLAARGEITPSTITASLRDHFSRPGSICSHPDESLPDPEQTQTNASMIMNLADRQLLGVRGPPCDGTFREYELT